MINDSKLVKKVLGLSDPDLDLKPGGVIKASLKSSSPNLQTIPKKKSFKFFKPPDGKIKFLGVDPGSEAGDLSAFTVIESTTLGWDVDPAIEKLFPQKTITEICMEGNPAPAETQDPAVWEHPDMIVDFSMTYKRYDIHCPHCHRDWTVLKEVIEDVGHPVVLLPWLIKHLRT